MSVEDTNALLAAVAMASQDAAARIQAAQISAEAQVSAAVQSTEISSNAEIQIATIESAWHQAANSAQIAVAQITADANLQAATTTAQTDSNARIQAATIQAQATTEAAHAEADAHTQAAETQANATLGASGNDANARIQAASAQANATIQAAQLQANAETSVAATRASADQAVAATQAGATTGAATIDAQARTTVAQTSGSFSVQAATVEASARTSAATTEADATKYSADRQFSGVTSHESAETGRLQMKLNFANDKFLILQPILDQIVNASTDFLGSFGGTPQGFNPNPPPQAPLGFRASAVATVQADADQRGYYRSYAGPPTIRMGDLDAPHDGGQGAGGSTAGTVTIQAPFISTRGVFTPAMLQAQVNAAYARNDSRTQALIRKSEGDLAGRGFSSTSPILEALKVGYITANLRASIEAATQIRLGAAQANTDAVFRAQQARSEQFIQQEGVLLDAERNQIQRQVGVLNAVASLVGGIL